MATTPNEFEATATGADIALVATLGTAQKVNLITFSRASAELITIVISVTINSSSYDLINRTNSDVTDIVITDAFILPANASINVTTTGVTTGAVSAFVLADPSLK